MNTPSAKRSVSSRLRLDPIGIHCDASKSAPYSIPNGQVCVNSSVKFQSCRWHWRAVWVQLKFDQSFIWDHWCQGCAPFAEIWEQYFEFQILWRLSSVDFHTLYIAIAYSNSKFCGPWTLKLLWVHLKFFSKTSTPQGCGTSVIYVERLM